MINIYRGFFIFICALILLSGCKKLNDTESGKPGTQKTDSERTQKIEGKQPPLLSVSCDIETFEFPPQALATWAQLSGQRPVFILLGDDPLLQPVPPSLLGEATRLAISGDRLKLREVGRKQIVNPIILPQQTLWLALHSGFFSEFVWILPTHSTKEELSLDAFRSQMTESGIMSKSEAESLTLGEGIFSGEIAGVPFRAAPLQAMPSITGNSVVHIDLSYFTALHKTEVTTPLYGLMHQTLSLLRQSGWNSATVTLSASNLEGEVPLEVRFLAEAIKKVFSEPNLLDTPMPETWELRRQALYLETFFQPEQVLDLYMKLASLEPQNAATEFDLYRTFVALKDLEQALKHLDMAADLDPAFSREYINKSIQALDKKQLEDGVFLLKRAAERDPNNPFIRLQIAEILLNQGQKEAGLKVLETLAKERWSSEYYPEVPSQLNGFVQKARAVK